MPADPTLPVGTGRRRKWHIVAIGCLPAILGNGIVFAIGPSGSVPAWFAASFACASYLLGCFVTEAYNAR